MLLVNIFKVPIPVLIFLNILFFVSGCGKQKEDTPRLLPYPCSSKIVATVNGENICKKDLEKIAETMDLKPEETLKLMIDDEILSQYAVSKGFLRSTSVIKDWKRALVQKLLEEEVEKKVPEESITFEEIKDYYVKNYAGKGKLLEEAIEEIKWNILNQRRKDAYENLIRKLQAKTKYSIRTEILETR